MSISLNFKLEFWCVLFYKFMPHKSIEQEISLKAVIIICTTNLKIVEEICSLNRCGCDVLI